MNLQIEVVKAENYVQIAPIGEIDVYSAPSFKEELFSVIQDTNKDLVIDGEKLDYIDSTGLGVLIGGLKRMKEKGLSITITKLNPNVHKLFTITALDKPFGIVKGR
jgi:anti-sigma B factor antagonist